MVGSWKYGLDFLIRQNTRNSVFEELSTIDFGIYLIQLMDIFSQNIVSIIIEERRNSKVEILNKLKENKFPLFTL